VPRLAFARDPLRVQFASPVYAPKGNVEYQYRLIGYDERWSPWSQQHEAVFTNLAGGVFTFEVRARRGSGGPGAVTRWKFAVRPPWWRSGPALAGGVLAVLGLGWLVLRWRMRALVRERARLEREVRERTEELALARDRAEAANRAKTMFLASMSHELRTPLHAILGYSQLLGGDQTLPDGARERLQIVANSGQHLLRLINEVLDLSKIEAGKLELRIAPFDLPALLTEIVHAQEARAAAKGLVFRRPDLAGLPAAVAGDAQKLRQVLDNLLGNAVKFTARGEVRLGVMPVAAGRVHFEVSDTGRGIAPEDLRRLFEPFTQARGAVEQPEAGTGLGLTIAHRLVALMGGELRVASTVGEGSRFWFEVDLAGASASAAIPGERRPKRRRIGYEGPRRRVLAIDDVEANRWLFRDLLAPLGFEIALAASAGEALAQLEHVRPDLVLLDLRLPGMDGFALARTLRADPRLEGVRILAASASVFGHDPGEAVAAGCDAFISKPFLPDDFLSRVGQLLDLTWREEEAAPAAVAESLSPEWLEALRTAAQLGDVVAMREACAELRQRHPHAAALDEIERAIDAFDTDRVGFLAAQQLPPRRQP
jgi:signal transduction histidine kinase/DNA-binding response OmpR family regulator